MPLSHAIAIVATTMAVGALLYVLVARRSPEGSREDRTPTNVYAVTAGAMSLLIAFTMSMTFSKYSNAQLATRQEAGQVVAMSRAAMFMPDPTRDALRNQLICYLESVIDEEWPAMRRGEANLGEATQHVVWRMDELLAQNALDAGPGVAMWESANESRSSARIERLLLAGSVVPPLLWVLLILGSLITIVSLFVFADRAKPAWGHVLVVIGPLFIASAALVVIAFFDHPYEDTAGGISPQPMEFAKSVITGERINQMPTAVCPNTHEKPQ